MPEFEDRQASLDQARRQFKQTKRELFATREKQKQIQALRDALKRRAGDDATGARIAELERQSKQLQNSAESLKTLVREHAKLEADELAAFLPFSDPTKNIARLDDRHPILLFPVRIETRFKKMLRDNQPIDQLWVRIYPDDIAVDTFEEFLAEVEIDNARIYWTNIWKAAGNDGEQRAAWQSLVKSHGAGRAFWIIQQFQPTNLADQPTKAAGDLILVVVSENPPPAIPKTAVQNYWRAIWLANKDQTAIDAAFAELVLAVGQDRAAEINADYAPQNLDQRPDDAAAVSNVRVEFLELPDSAQIQSQQQPWSQPANTAVLPERFVLLGYNNDQQTLMQIGNPIPSDLAIGPNPSADADEQMRLEGDELVVPDEMKWMVDFDQAVEKGMGFRVNLSLAQARLGYDRLFVLGVRISADIQKSKEQLETLITHHQNSRKGFRILPQGAPTNNVEDNQSGYRWEEDSDNSYDHYFTQDTTDDPADWRDKKDGRWLAEYLGVDPEIIKAAPNYYATDQCESRAMNIALWPGTLGSFMEQLMEPVFSDDTIVSTREYFNRYVRGRGSIPAIRVGNQPYGILAATPFSRMAWISREVLGDDRFETGVPRQFQFLTRLYALILQANATWTELQKEVSFVGKPGVDPQQALLDVLGLHPSSVEYYQRYAETLEQLINRFKYTGIYGSLIGLLVGLGYISSGADLLKDFGYDANEAGIPEVLTKFFLKAANLLKGPVIDNAVLSETDPIYSQRGDGANYIQWLIAAGKESHDALRLQKGFIDRRPNALLYLMLHHALDVSYVETSLQLHLQANLMTREEVVTARKPPKFIHIQEKEQDAGSLWQYLYKPEPAITNDPMMTIAQFIPQILTTLNPYLNSQFQALEHLQDVPTARLERVLAEHIDCCMNRLDAWWLGLVDVQLGLMRSTEAFGGDATVGSYLGAFGWLENVRSENKNFAPVELDEDLTKIFRPTEDPPLMRDPHNFGYIHAPSLNHAVAAAVLRNGYLSNATPDNPESLAINLTSQRVRIAMDVIEGIRNGQSLSALLGYRFERGLHDQENLFLDELIFELRRQFPLAGNRLSSTKTTTAEDAVAIQAIEARNVIDGLALIEHVQNQSPANKLYPFGLSKLPDVPEANKRAAIDTQVARIMDINDAVADLAMAESVYQVVQGNYDRAAGTLEAFSKGNFPPTPEVVQTPRSGVTLTHRVGLHFEGSLDPAAAANQTPRAKGEPAINKWLSDYLPALTDIVCEVEYFDHAISALRTETVTPSDLGMLPIDLFFTLNMDSDQQMKALDDRILFQILDTFALRPDVEIKITYRVKQAGKISFFELSPYLRNLRALLLSSRPLRPTDVQLPNEADKAQETTMAINVKKISEVRDLLLPLSNNLNALFVELTTLIENPDPDAAAAATIDQIDQLIASYQQIADAISRFGLPSAGLGFSYDWRRRQFSSLIQKLDDFINRWDDQLAAFDQRILDYAALDASTSDEEKFKFLLSAGRLIWTEPIVPLPATPDQLRDDLNDNKRLDFNTVLTQLKSIRDNRVQISGLYQDMDGQIANLALHDLQTIELAENRQAIVAFSRELKSKAESFSSDVIARLDKVAELLTGAPETDSEKRISQLTQAARQLLGEDFVVLPEFTLSADQGTEWQNAWDHRGDLLQFLQNEEAVDFPVDEWLYGVARVREKIHHLESATVFANALSNKDLDLHPLQMPYRADDSWLGLKFPEKIPGTDEPFKIDEDKLLYTAHYHMAFTKTDSLFCGVLIDEWTEVIPTIEETTGLTFHYDRPNSEPPQVLLLATPANFTGQWQWKDLVDTLHETLDMARKRAVEPQHVDATPFARFLPAILSEVAVWPITTSLNFSLNNEILDHLKANP